MNILWHSTNILLYIKIWLLIDKLKVYGIQLKKLGLATSWGGVSLLSGGRYFRGVATFGGSLLSGFTSGHKKLTLFSGGSLSELYSKFSKPSSIVAGSKKWLQAVNLTGCHLIRRTLQSIVKNVKLCALENTLYSRKNLLLADENN